MAANIPAKRSVTPPALPSAPTPVDDDSKRSLQIRSVRDRIVALRSAPKRIDEPTGGLDVSVQARLLDLVRQLVSDLGLSAIVVTHDLAVARLLSHRLIVMQRGRIVETGLTDQVLDDPQHPYSQLLVSSILRP